MTTDREVSLEQAIVALFSEAKEAGVDLVAIGEKAKSGIIGNKEYTWVSPGQKIGVKEAIDYLVGRIG